MLREGRQGMDEKASKAKMRLDVLLVERGLVASL
jgi:hypothetical protein